MAVGIGAGVAVGIGAGVAVGIGAGVAVGTGAGVAVGVGAGVAVGTGAGVAVGIGAGVAVGAGTGVAVGTGTGVTTGAVVGRGVDLSTGSVLLQASRETTATPSKTATAAIRRNLPVRRTGKVGGGGGGVIKERALFSKSVATRQSCFPALKNLRAPEVRARIMVIVSNELVKAVFPQRSRILTRTTGATNATGAIGATQGTVVPAQAGTRNPR